MWKKSTFSSKTPTPSKASPADKNSSSRKTPENKELEAQKKPLTPLKASSAEKTSSSKKTPTPEKKEPEADKKALIQKSQDEKEASAVEKEPLLVEVCPIVAKKEQMKKVEFLIFRILLLRSISGWRFLSSC